MNPIETISYYTTRAIRKLQGTTASAAEEMRQLNRTLLLRKQYGRGKASNF